MTNQAWTLRAGAILGALGVIAGAFGAHALASHVSTADLAAFETAVRYQLVHAVTMCAMAALPTTSRGMRIAATAMFAGTVIFSGSLYVLVLSGLRWFGAITPIGGVLLVVGWIALASATPRRGAPTN